MSDQLGVREAFDKGRNGQSTRTMRILGFVTMGLAAVGAVVVADRTAKAVTSVMSHEK